MIRSFHRIGTFGLFALIVATLGWGAPIARAQQSESDEVRFERRIQDGERDLRRGNAERARRIFEELLAERPENSDAFSGYVSARVAAYDLDGLADLVRGRISANGPSAELSFLLGDVYAASGKRDDAVEVWRGALALVDDPDEGYRRVAHRMEERRMIPEAVAFLREGRAASGDRFRFAGDLCRLLLLTGESEEAAREWVRAAADGSQKGAEAMRRLRELREDGEIASYPYDELVAVLDSLPDRTGLREILAECYLDDGDCARARAEYEELERGQPRCGTYLMNFARRAADQGCVRDAAAAAAELGDRCDRPSVRLEARFLQGRLQRRLGDGEGAANTYREILRDTKNVRETSQARLDLATVLVDDLGDGARAIPVLDEFLRQPGDPQAVDARFLLAKARLLTGDFEAALGEYRRIHDAATNDGTRERAIFGMGRTLFFEGQMDSALAEYRRVVDQYPTGFYLNDAIEQSIFITDHRDAGDAALREYADCLLKIERKDLSGAKAKLETLLGTLAVANLRDELTWRLGRVAEEEGQYKKAVEIYEKVVTDFPDARLAHDASLRVADLYCNRLGDIPRGIARYEKFLVDYPASILADEARKRLREAESENES